MERVKEESRRKSEELEMLRNSVQQGLSYPPPEPIYSQNPIRREEITHRGLHDFESIESDPCRRLCHGLFKASRVPATDSRKVEGSAS